MKTIKTIFIFCFFALITNSINAQNTSSDYLSTNYEVQFVRTGLQGTELFKVYSYGKNDDQAINNAKSDAVKAILFKGIPGSGYTSPMITDFSLLESKKDFFNTFFETDQFQQYVSVSGDGTVEEKYKVGKRVKVAVIVSVQKDNLRKFLESAGIIRKFGLD